MGCVALLAVGYGTWAVIVPEGDRKKELVKVEYVCKIITSNNNDDYLFRHVSSSIAADAFAGLLYLIYLKLFALSDFWRFLKDKCQVPLPGMKKDVGEREGENVKRFMKVEVNSEWDYRNDSNT